MAGRGDGQPPRHGKHGAAPQHQQLHDQQQQEPKRLTREQREQKRQAIRQQIQQQFRNLPLDKITGVIYGQCIGDAIGLATEFMSKSQATKFYGDKKQLEYVDKVPDRHRSRWTVGDWTDDTDQMILIMQSIIDRKGQIDRVDYAEKIYRWSRKGFPELGDFGGNGLGTTTRHVLDHPDFKTNPFKAAHTIWETSGKFVAPNGGVQRTSCLGIYHFNDINAVIKNCREICRVTHADFRCQASCIAVSTAIAMMLQGKHTRDGKVDASAITEDAYRYACDLDGGADWTEDYKQELRSFMFPGSLDILKLDESHKIGYTYKTLGAGFWALQQNDFRAALEAIVREGGDADTNGAVAGALLGCKLGYEKLPPTWRDQMPHSHWLEEIFKKFLEVMMGQPPSSVSSRT